LSKKAQLLVSWSDSGLGICAEGDRQSRPQTEYRLFGEDGIFSRVMHTARLKKDSVLTAPKRRKLHSSCVHTQINFPTPVKKHKSNQIKLAEIGAETHQERLKPLFSRWIFDSCFSK
jgi:hypothetical protein